MPRAKTARLPGMEADSIPELSQLAEEYETARDQRLLALGKEVDLGTRLTEMMRQHGLTNYRDSSYDPVLTVSLIPTKEKIKVKRETDEEMS